MEDLKNVIDEDNVEEKTSEEVVSEEETSNEPSPSDYKIIVSMVREMEDQYAAVEESLHNAMKSKYRLNPDVLDMILPYELESIKDLDVEEMRDFLTKNCIYRDDRTYTHKSKSELVKIMTTIKEASLSLLTTKMEADNIRKESSEVLQEYFNYMSSDKVKKSREKRLEAMKKAVELESDSYKKTKMNEMIKAMEESMNYSFLQKRFEKFGDREIKNIKEGFFDDKKGKYVMDRYKEKIRRYGFNPEIYKYFFNIEENFLAKKYSPYNNLFLFIYMRMVAYADINSKTDNLLVHSITGALANLIYHKFNSTETEKYFLQVVSEVLDRFENDRDYFIENNTSYEEHPVRKEAELKHEEKRRKHLIRKMDELQIKGYDPEASADELLEYFNKENELLIKKQLNRDKDEELTIDDGEEVDTTTENDELSVETDIDKVDSDVEIVNENLTTVDESVETDVEEETPVEEVEENEIVTP